MNIMEDSSENLSRQIDEIEALSSIYGNEWCVVDEANRTYSINITDQEENPNLNILIQVSLPLDYPSHSPPQYQISAPWLRGDDRRMLSNSLEEIFLENIGENIIYLWVEKIREFLVEKSADPELGQSDVEEKGSTHNEVFQGEYDGHSNVVGGATAAAVVPSQTVIEMPVIYHGEPMSDRKSKFQAHLAPVVCKEQISMVLDKLLENRKIASATHNIYSYRILLKGNNFLQGCVDDGEIHAGSRMLHLMQIVNACNVMVIVTRWYGGIHLGPDRFKHINNLARQIMEDHGYIERKGEKKGGSSKKSR